jgi:hypothetical protein
LTAGLLWRSHFVKPGDFFFREHSFEAGDFVDGPGKLSCRFDDDLPVWPSLWEM